MEAKQTAEAPEIDGWAIVEIMGHNRAAGRVKTVSFGSTVMLRIDTPDLPELERPARFSYGGVEKEIAPAEPGFTQYVGMGSIFRLTPCTEEAARVALEHMRRLPARPLEPPPMMMVATAEFGSDDLH